MPVRFPFRSDSHTQSGLILKVSVRRIVNFKIMHQGIYLNIGRVASSSKTPQGGKSPVTPILICYYVCIIDSLSQKRSLIGNRMTREWCVSMYLGLKDVYWLIFIGFAITVLSKNFHWQLGVIYKQRNIGGKRIRKGASMHIRQLPNVCHLH